MCGMTWKAISKTAGYKLMKSEGDGIPKMERPVGLRPGISIIRRGVLLQMFLTSGGRTRHP